MQHTSKHPIIIWLAASVILLTLALRMTITESVRVAFSDRIAALTDPTLAQTPAPGPAHTVAFTVIILLASAAVFATNRFTKRDWIFLAISIVISAFMLASIFAAQNKFAALIGTCDVIMSLSACAALLILSRDLKIKQLFIATVIALTVVWVAKGFYQYFIETPDTVKYIEDNWPQILQQRGWQADDSQAIQFLARVHSREITGYITFSNVVAAGTIPMILLCLALTWQFATKPRGFNPGVPNENPAATKQIKSADKDASQDIPLLPVIAVLAALLGIAATALLLLSDSKGGIGAFALCLPLAILGLLLPARIAQHRKKLLITAALLAVLGASAIVGYGLKRDGLPSLSLLYRWHYWKGSAQIIKHAPALGVGFNNFGDYYTQVKPPESPEDVKDPHSIFVRFAAETGLPATILIAGLIFWLIARGLHPRTIAESAAWTKPALFAAAALLALWWIIRLFIAEIPDLQFNIYVMILNAALAAGAATLVLAAFNKAAPQSVSPILNVLLIGAVGMLIYDQINMGLTTGPVAMFFWCILAVAASPDSQLENNAPRIAEKLTAGVFVTASILLSVFVFGPLTSNTFTWDPTPWEDRAIRSNSTQDALDNWNQAIARNPRSIELLRRRMQVKAMLNQPIELDIEEILALNTTDARLHMDLALIPSKLSPERRKEILTRALWLDDQMPADQPRKLKESERTKMKEALK